MQAEPRFDFWVGYFRQSTLNVGAVDGCLALPNWISKKGRSGDPCFVFTAQNVEAPLLLRFAEKFKVKDFSGSKKNLPVINQQSREVR